jgi:hypothetical protein
MAEFLAGASGSYDYQPQKSLNQQPANAYRLMEEARNFAGQAAEDALDFALKGDMQIYRFKATSKHPAFPGFAAGIAEMRNGIDVLHPKVNLALGNLPGLDDLDRIV